MLRRDTAGRYLRATRVTQPSETTGDVVQVEQMRNPGPRPGRALATAVCAAAVLVTAACGSTVQTRSAVGTASNQGLDTGTTQQPRSGDASRPGGLDTPAGPTGTATTGARGGASTPGTSGPELPTTGTEGSGPAIAGARTPVQVGIITSGNFGSLGSALGANLNTGDQRQQTQLIVSYLNAHGGLQGHPIRPVYYDYDTSASQPVNSQAACSAFTEDNHAIAAMGVAGMDDVFAACAEKHGMISLSDNGVKGSSFFRRYPSSIQISEMALDRKYHGMVLALSDMGFFTPGAKVGLLYTDDPYDLEGVRKGMKPALATIGVTPTEEVELSSASGDPASQYSSAVLRFRAAGITHVVFGYAAAWLFAQGADAQGYYPALGLDSRQSPGVFMQTVNSKRSLANAMGMGYLPIADVDGDHDPGPVSARARLCSKIFDDAQQGFGSNALAKTSALVLCDALFFLQDAFAGQPDLSRASFLGGVAGIGDRYASTLSFATRFSASQHDGPQAYRPLRYQSGCGCFQYAGPVKPIR